MRVAGQDELVEADPAILLDPLRDLSLLPTMWDNRWRLHYATRYYGGFRRIMHRVTWRGEEPVGPSGR